MSLSSMVSVCYSDLRRASKVDVILGRQAWVGGHVRRWNRPGDPTRVRGHIRQALRVYLWWLFVLGYRYYSDSDIAVESTTKTPAGAASGAVRGTWCRKMVRPALSPACDESQEHSMNVAGLAVS